MSLILCVTLINAVLVMVIEMVHNTTTTARRLGAKQELGAISIFFLRNEMFPRNIGRIE